MVQLFKTPHLDECFRSCSRGSRGFVLSCSRLLNGGNSRSTFAGLGSRDLPVSQPAIHREDKTTYRNDEGNYVVKLPKKNRLIQQQGDSRSTVIKRFLGVGASVCLESGTEDTHISGYGPYDRGFRGRYDCRFSCFITLF